MARDDDDDLFGLDEEESIDPGGTRTTVVEASDRSEPDDEPEEQSRLDKKRERGTLFKAYQESERRNAELLERVTRLEGTVPQPQQQQQPDPYEVGIYQTIQKDRQLREYAQNLIGNAAREGKQVDPEQMKKLDDAIVMNDLERQQLVAERAARRVAAETNNPRRAAQEVLQAQYDDVRKHPKALNWAQARYTMAIAEGADESPATLKQVMTEARSKFGIARTRTPSEGDRRRYANVSAGSGSGSGPERPRSRTLTDQEKAMATAMYDKMPEEKAWKMFAKTVLAEKT